jgi:hypothetical protein
MNCNDVRTITYLIHDLKLLLFQKEEINKHNVNADGLVDVYLRGGSNFKFQVPIKMAIEQNAAQIAKVEEELSKFGVTTDDLEIDSFYQ